MENKVTSGCDGASAGLDLRLQVFYTSPDAGDRDCICSLCLKRIDEGEVPIRIFGIENEGTRKRSIEMRFHRVPCFKLLVPLFLNGGFTL